MIQSSRGNTSDTLQGSPLSYARYCDEIVTQTDLLRMQIRDADMTASVPTCPGWNLGQLLRHLGGAHRAIEKFVRTQADRGPDDNGWRDLSAYTNENPAVLDEWLAEGAALLADSLRKAGSESSAFNPVPGGVQTTVFSARRMTHETVIHRSDATLAIGEAFNVAPDIAVDAIDEWMELTAIPEMFDMIPTRRGMLGPGRTLRFRASDLTHAEITEWFVDLTGNLVIWRRARGEAAVSLTAPLTDILLILYRRRPIHGEGVTIHGDANVLESWQELTAFG